MSAQQVSFPHSPVRHWFLFWKRSPKWHQFPPRHNSSPWHRTKTFLTQREEHHAWHIYSRGLCSTLPSSLPPPLFFSIDVCPAARSVYRIIKELLWLQWLRFSDLTHSPCAFQLQGLSSMYSCTDTYLGSLSEFNIQLLKTSILDFFPPPLLISVLVKRAPRAECLLKKWPPTGLCLTLCHDWQMASLHRKNIADKEKSKILKKINLYSLKIHISF